MIDLTSRRLKFKKRQLEILIFFKESLERRLASVEASISTLEAQIEKDTPKS